MRWLRWLLQLSVIGTAILAAVFTATVVQNRWLSQSRHWGTGPDGTSQLVHDGSSDWMFVAVFIAPYVGIMLLALLCRARPWESGGLLVVTLLLAGVAVLVIAPDASNEQMGNHGKGVFA